MIYCYAEIKNSSAFFTRGVECRPHGRQLNEINLEGFVISTNRPDGSVNHLGKERSRVWINLEFDSSGTDRFNDPFGQPFYSDDCIGRFVISGLAQSGESVTAKLSVALPIDQFVVLWSMRGHSLKVFCDICENDDRSLAIKDHGDGHQTVYIKNIKFETDVYGAIHLADSQLRTI